jgi:hypothetical protein
MQEIFDHHPHRREYIVNRVRILLDNEEEEPVLMVVWVTMSPAIDHDPAERWKTCQMPLSTLNDLWFTTFNTHPKELAEIGLPTSML